MQNGALQLVIRVTGAPANHSYKYHDAVTGVTTTVSYAPGPGPTDEHWQVDDAGTVQQDSGYIFEQDPNDPNAQIRSNTISFTDPCYRQGSTAGTISYSSLKLAGPNCDNLSFDYAVTGDVQTGTERQFELGGPSYRSASFAVKPPNYRGSASLVISGGTSGGQASLYLNRVGAHQTVVAYDVITLPSCTKSTGGQNATITYTNVTLTGANCDQLGFDYSVTGDQRSGTSRQFEVQSPSTRGPVFTVTPPDYTGTGSVQLDSTFAPGDQDLVYLQTPAPSSTVVAEDVVTLPSCTKTSTNHAPVANNDSATTTQNTAVTTDVVANDTDADGDTLTVQSVSAPANGTTAISGTRSVTYTPNSGYVGSDSYTYTVSDGKGGTATATVSVTVNAPPAQPPAQQPPVTQPPAQQPPAQQPPSQTPPVEQPPAPKPAVAPKISKNESAATAKAQLKGLGVKVGDVVYPTQKGKKYVAASYALQTTKKVKVHGVWKTVKVYTILRQGTKLKKGSVIAVVMKRA